MSYIDRQVELRNRAWEEAKAILDVAEAEKRDLSAEEEVKYARINEDLGKRAEVISSLRADEEQPAAGARQEHEPLAAARH